MTVLEEGESKAVECPDCGESFEVIGQHWRGLCEPPQFSERQLDLIRGLIMGDGCILETNGNAHFIVVNTNLAFLEWLDDEFGVMSTGVRLDRSAESISSSEMGQKTGYEYKDVYRLGIRSHPTLTALREKWYSNGKVRIPDDFVLSPLPLKIWYVSDGNVGWGGVNSRITIACLYENDRPHFITTLFYEAGLKVTYPYGYITVRAEDKEDFFAYMGDSVDGFEYKWEFRDEDRYYSLKP